MLRLAKERDTITVVNDQFGSPTSAMELGRMILHIVFVIFLRVFNRHGKHGYSMPQLLKCQADIIQIVGVPLITWQDDSPYR